MTEAKLPEPQAQPELSRSPINAPEPHPLTKKTRKKTAGWKILGIVVLCVASSTLSSWTLLATGLIRPEATMTITQNREKLVLQEGEIVADVFKKVNPATVAITIETRSGASRFSQPSVQHGAGSGTIISSDGYILTNKHVVPEGASKITVVLADGRELSDVSVVGRDPSNDIAFLKINGVSDLPFAEIGDSSKMEPGMQVVAIGNALGEFRNSVTIGIISGLGRPVEAATDEVGADIEKLENLFQTDAAINPGNSGGPLVNLEGKVVGINTAIAEEAEGIGFAIPINDAKALIESVLKNGKISKAYLGVRYVSLTEEVAEQLELDVSQGAYVSGNSTGPGVIENGPAAKAGIKEQDIITKVNGVEVSETTSLGNLLARQAPGDVVTLIVLRDDREMSLEVTLEDYPSL